MEVREKISVMLEKAASMPVGDTQIHLLEEAVKLSDKHQLVDLGFLSREYLTDFAAISGHWELIPIHFPWMLAMADEYPDQFGGEQILDAYIDAVQSLPFFTRVKKSQILAAQEELTRRFQASGRSMQRVWHIRFLNAIEMGDLEFAGHWFQKLDQSGYLPANLNKEGDISRYAYDAYSRGWYFCLKGDLDRGLDDLEQVYSRPHLSPVLNGFALAIALNFRLEARRFDGLEHLFRRCSREVRGKKGMIEPYYWMMFFLGKCGKTSTIFRFFPEFVQFGEEIHNELDKLGYLMAAYTCVLRIGNLSGHIFQGNLPVIHPLFRENGQVETSELASHFKERAGDLAQKFDKRNENEYYSQRLARLAQVQPSDWEGTGFSV